MPSTAVSGPLRAGLIEAMPMSDLLQRTPRVSGPLRAGLIEAACSAAAAFRSGNVSGPLRAGLIEAWKRTAPARVAWSAFPAPCGPASLKRTRGVPRRRPLGAVSGPLRAGLIEAGPPRPRKARESIVSGPLRAGLIEAGATPPRRRSSRPAFPAPCGPASLKQIANRELGGGKRIVSGPLRAGLIEARARRTTAWPCISVSGPLRAGLIEALCSSISEEISTIRWRTFPAPCGPASLKPYVPDAVLGRERAPFPAPCGPASLKPGVGRTFRRTSRTVSGPLRAGLIEARRRSGAVCAASTSVSGPLRAGLIEARPRP